MTLGSNVDYALHALAIDEKRGPFLPALWQLPSHRGFSYVEQVWFPGAHSNIGGSYEDCSLSDRALHWMISRIEKREIGLTFFSDWEETVKPSVCGKLYESRTAAYQWSRHRPMVRVINQCRPQPINGARMASLPRHAIPIGEAVDYSALQRWRLSEDDKGVIERYCPANLEAALDKTFTPDNPRPIPIVDEDGEPYNWLRNERHYEELKEFLPKKYQCLYDKTVAASANSNEDLSEFSNSYQGSRISQRMGGVSDEQTTAA